MFIRPRIFLCVALAITASGCASGGLSNDPVTATEVDAVQLMASPTAINTDDDPRPDSFQVRVQFFRLDKPESVLISGGKVEFAVFEGRQSAAAIPRLKPLRTWAYTSDQLAGVRTIVLGGPAYDLMLRFPGGGFPSRIVTMVVAYRSAGGTEVMSAPTLLSSGND